MKVLSIITILTVVAIVASLNSGCAVASGQTTTGYAPALAAGQTYTFYFNGGGNLTATMEAALSDYWIEVYETTNIQKSYYINMQNVTYTVNPL